MQCDAELFVQLFAERLRPTIVYTFPLTFFFASLSLTLSVTFPFLLRVFFNQFCFLFLG